MRIKLTLQAPNDFTSIPINYQYPLSAAIYKILSVSSEEYSKYLHNKGYLGTDGKPRKLFNFSNLFFKPRAMIKDQCLVIQPQSIAYIYISSPMIDDFIRNLFIGLVKIKHIYIETKNIRVAFNVMEIEALPSPEFESTTYFQALSPIVVKTTTKGTKYFKTYYYRPLDAELPKAVRESLIRKYITVYGEQPQNDQLEFTIDHAYINRKGGQEKVSKLITIREGHSDATKIKAFLCPFTLSGSKELMQIAWECGLGDKTNMGFGCIDMVK